MASNIDESIKLKPIKSESRYFADISDVAGNNNVENNQRVINSIEKIEVEQEKQADKDANKEATEKSEKAEKTNETDQQEGFKLNNPVKPVDQSVSTPDSLERDTPKDNVKPEQTEKSDKKIPDLKSTDQDSIDNQNEEKRRNALMASLKENLIEDKDRLHLADKSGRPLASDDSTQLSFKDQDFKMQTATNNPRVAHTMAKMADAKGWQKMKVSGHKDFRREVWLEASSRGIEVSGFKPSKDDLLKLQDRKEKDVNNSVERVNLSQEKSQEKNQKLGNDRTADQLLPSQIQVNQDKSKVSKTQLGEGVGVVLGHGQARYNNDKDEKMSYFVKMRTDNGEKTVWGVDLKRATAENKTDKGDKVTLTDMGKKEVEVDALVRKNGKVVLDENGKPSKERINAVRREWEVKTLEKVKNKDPKQIELSKTAKTAKKETSVTTLGKDKKEESADKLKAKAVAFAIISQREPNSNKRQQLKDHVSQKIDKLHEIGGLPKVGVYDKKAPPVIKRTVDKVVKSQDKQLDQKERVSKKEMER
jgi:hypothetical protein